MSQDSVQPCPILTHAAVSLQEAVQGEVPEIRAYKLGKRRWSYNQVELVICEAGEGGRVLTVKQAVNMGTDNFKEEVRESSVSFQVQLANEYRVQVHAFLCYDSPLPVEVAAEGEGPGDVEEQYQWSLVDRCACQKGCSGPVLRAIQRFGKLGKRAWGTAASPDLTDRTNNNMKDPRYFYLSFDEAGTHVGVKTFRLVVAVYDQGGRRRLSTCVSTPIRVLANNDVPTGAAHILLHAQIPSTWEGWQGVPANPSDGALFLPMPPPPTRTLPGGRMATSPMLSTPASRPRPSASDDSGDHSHHSSSGGEKRLRVVQAQVKQEDMGYMAGAAAAGARYHPSAGPVQQQQHPQDRRARRRLSLGQEDPDYVPRRNGPTSSGAAHNATRHLPPRWPALDSHHYEDPSPSASPQQSPLPSPGATNSNTSHPLLTPSSQPQGGGMGVGSTYALHQGGGQQTHLLQQHAGLLQGGRGTFNLGLDADHFVPLGLQSFDIDVPQLIQSHALTLGGNGRPSPVTSPYHSASHPSPQQNTPNGNRSSDTPSHGHQDPSHLAGGLFLQAGQQHQQQIMQDMGHAQQHHRHQQQQQHAGGRFGLSPPRGMSPVPLPLSLSPGASHLLLDPSSAGGAHQRAAFSGHYQLDPMLGEDPINAFLEILMKSQAAGPGSPVIELPSLSPGGSPTKSPFRRAHAFAPMAAGGNPPSSMSNATAFGMLPASPLSPSQQQQQHGGARPSQQAPPMQAQQHQQQSRQQLQYGRGQLPPHQQQQHHGGFGSTISLFQEPHSKAAQQQHQQQQAELFFRRSPGLSLGMDPTLMGARMAPMQGKMEGQMMGPGGMDHHHHTMIHDPPRLLPASELSPLHMAHSPNSISTPTPSALDDIFNSFQPTLETAAEALMHGDSAFAATAIKPEPGVSSGTQPGALFMQHGNNSLAVQ